MEYITIIWKFLTLLYTVFICVKSQSDLYHLPGHTPPVFDSLNDVVTVNAGEEAVLACVGNHMENSQITWLQNLSTLIATGGTMMVIDERISIDHKPNGHEYLTITNASIHDMSQFSCMLDSFPPTMKNFDLIVKAPAKIDKSNMIDSHRYVQGELKKLHCKVGGYPKPDIKWYFYRTDADQQKETKELVSTNEHLILKNLSKADEGIYRCEAKNEGGEDMYEIFFQAIFEPILSTTMKRTHAKLGHTAVLYCEIESNPFGDILWQKNDEEIRTSWKYKIEMYAESAKKKMSVLNIINVDFSDNGMYICQSRNHLGRDNIKLFLTVEDPNLTTTTEATTQPPKPVQKTTTTTTMATKSPDNIVEVQTTSVEIVETPRTDASKNAGVHLHGNFLIGLLLSVLMKCFVL